MFYSLRCWNAPRHGVLDSVVKVLRERDLGCHEAVPTQKRQARQVGHVGKTAVRKHTRTESTGQPFIFRHVQIQDKDIRLCEV